MRKLLTGIITAGIVFGVSTAASAQTYADFEEISDYAKDYVEVLQQLDILVGYPDGTFKPKANLTREEYATSLIKALVTLEEGIFQAIEEENAELYSEIVALQKTVYTLLAEVDELRAKEVAQRNNFIGLSVVYVTDRDGDTENVVVELNGKLQIIKISNRFAISLRPFVNTATEIGASATLDLDITNDLELFAGIGAAYRADQDVKGTITGFDTDVVPYGHAGLSLDLSERVALTLDGKIPFDSKEGKEPTVGLGINFKF